MYSECHIDVLCLQVESAREKEIPSRGFCTDDVIELVELWLVVQHLATPRLVAVRKDFAMSQSASERALNRS